MLTNDWVTNEPFLYSHQECSLIINSKQNTITSDIWVKIMNEDQINFLCMLWIISNAIKKFIQILVFPIIY